MRRCRRRPEAEIPWDGLCGHPSGLRTPEEMVKIARAKMLAMENHPGLAWLRAEDDLEMARKPRRGRFQAGGTLDKYSGLLS